jgi:hypothetical protein
MRLRFFAYLLVISTPLSIAGSALAAPPPAAAQPSPPTSAKAKDHADELFDQGTAAFDAGRFAEAETKFEQAWALKQTHDIAGNLGIVKIHLGKTAEGAKHLAWALEHLPPTEASSTRKGLEQELQKARSAISSVHIRVNVAGAEITVNGHVAGKSPLADEVFVEPGVVNVAVRLDGYSAVQEAPTVRKGETHEVSLELVKRTDVPEKRSLVPGVVLGSVAGAALAVGIGLLVDAGAKGSHAKELSDAIVAAGHGCAAGTAIFDSRCAEVQSTASAGDSHHSAGVGVLIGAGAVAVGTAAYFLWPTSRASAPAAGALRFVPAVSTTNAGLLYTGTF